MDGQAFDLGTVGITTWRSSQWRMRVRRRLLAVLGTLVFLFLVVTRCSADDDVITSPVIARQSLQMDLPISVPAGEPIPTIVSGVAPNVPLEVTVDAGYGVSIESAVPTSSTVEVIVPPFAGPASGVVTVSVVQGTEVARGQTAIVPGDPVDAIDVYLGPRTVIADAEHFVMIVGVPKDVFGNPVSTGTPVDFTVTRPNLAVEKEQHPTRHLLAYQLVYSRTVTGRTRVATESGSAGAPERDFLEVAGVPVPFKLELVDPIVPADGQALMRIRTEVLRDPFGNVMPDGVVVYLDADGVTGRRRIQSQSIDGLAEFTLEVPDRPGQATVTASASGSLSETLTLDFPTAVESLTAEVENDGTFIRVHVGPVRSVRGSFVPDGTNAVVTLGDGTSVTTDLTLGIGTASFPLDSDMSSVTVEVLGAIARVEGVR